MEKRDQVVAGKDPFSEQKDQDAKRPDPFVPHPFRVPARLDPLLPRPDPIVPGSIWFVPHPFRFARKWIRFLRIRFTLLHNRISLWIALIPFFRVMILLFGVVIPLWWDRIRSSRSRSCCIRLPLGQEFPQKRLHGKTADSSNRGNFRAQRGVDPSLSGAQFPGYAHKDHGECLSPEPRSVPVILSLCLGVAPQLVRLPR